MYVYVDMHQAISSALATARRFLDKWIMLQSYH
jgi:UDP-galactopyranose mutase